MTSTIGSFTDSNGWNWENEDDLTPLQLCGRDRESHLLLSTFQQNFDFETKSTGPDATTTKVILIHGESGIGKTVLVDSFRKQVVDRYQGYFCSGKYFQDSFQQEPYSAIVAALSDLCELVSLEGAVELQNRKIVIESVMDSSDLVLLSQVVTGLSLLLEEDVMFQNNFDASEPVEESKMISKIKVACESLLRGLSSAMHPIVLFIDDLQWMDNGSRSIVEHLLGCSALKQVTFIFAYRQEEAASVADLFDDFLLRSDQVVDIHLQRLDALAIQEVVINTMGGLSRVSSLDDVSKLSELVLQRSNGNPFHAIQFLEFLQMEQFITFDVTSKTFVFDLEEIISNTMIAESIATLLQKKIQHLPLSTQETLKIAAIVGFSFKEDIVLDVIQMNPKRLTEEGTEVNASIASVDATRFLKSAVKGGFLEKTKYGYKFTHDKLQDAFHAMVDVEEGHRLHQIVGEAHLAYEGRESLYYAASHLNKTLWKSKDIEKRTELARVNLEAAKYCRGKAAFSEAVGFLSQGLEMVQLNDVEKNEMWSKQFDLVFEMTEQLAQMQCVVGNIDACCQFTAEALRHGKSLEMKLNLLVLDINARMTDHRIDDSIETATNVLGILGLRIPPKVKTGHVLRKIIRVKRLIGRKSDEDILSLPVVDDPVMKTTLRVLFNLTIYCLVKDDQNKSSFAALYAAELTLKHGLCPHSAAAFTVYGIAEIHLGNIAQGARFGNLAMAMTEHVRCNEIMCPVLLQCAAFLLHWNTHVKDLLGMLDRSQQIGYQHGEVIYAISCTATFFAGQILIGKYLPDLEDYMRSQRRYIETFRQPGLSLWIGPSFQWVLNMQRSTSNWSELTKLSGDAMIESEYLQEATNDGHVLLLITLWSYKLSLCYEFGFHDAAELMLKELDAKGQMMQLHFFGRWVSVYSFLTYFAQYRSKGGRKYLRKARKSKNALMPGKSPNNPALYALLTAEEMTLKGRKCTAKVLQSFDAAITAFQAESWYRFEALANERAGFYAYNMVGDVGLACGYFRRAVDLYEKKWGAVAKCEWLENLVQQVCIDGQDKSNILLSAVGQTIEISGLDHSQLGH